MVIQENALSADGYRVAGPLREFFETPDRRCTNLFREVQNAVPADKHAQMGAKRVRRAIEKYEIERLRVIDR